MLLETMILAVGLSSGTLYLDVINDSKNSLVSLEIAPTGTHRWQAMDFEKPLHGGGNSTTVGLTRQGCLYDLRMRFNRGPTLLHLQYNVCKGRRYHIDYYRRRARSNTTTTPFP